MQRNVIKKILLTGEEGQDVSICAWVRTKRVSKNFAFLSVNDGSCQDTLQMVIDGQSSAYNLLPEIQTGAAVCVKGELIASPGKGQAWEIRVHSLEILGKSDQDYPLQKKGHSLEFLREIAHLRPRTNTFGAIFRIRHTLSMAIHQFFDQRGFVWAQTPILTASDCEGAGELFQVTTLKNAPLGENSVDYKKDFFSKASYLTVSGQLEAEFLALSLGNVYTFGPTFRAENSNTTRHLAEFWMVEPEMAFTDLQENMEIAEEFTRYILKQTLEKCSKELAFLEKFQKSINIAQLEKITEESFARITYTEAVKLLKDAQVKFEFSPEWGKDLQTEHERYLAETILGKPVFVTDYPQEIKSFYMRQNDDGKTVAAMDLLVPGIGELIGGSQREERIQRLEKKMSDFSIPKEDLQWYLDLRRFGSVEHSGFGMGFERMIMFVTGMSNIRDVTLCPRAPGLIDF